jgi:hypothetical protein
MQAVGRKNMTLLEAAREHVACAIRQSAEMRLFVTGVAKGGRGKNDLQRKASKHAKAMKQVKAFCHEIDEMTNDVQDLASVFIPKSGKHRPPDTRKSPSCASPGANAETVQPLHLAFFSGVTNLKVCYGCKKQFADKYKKKPHNIILKHFCRRSYKGQGRCYEAIKNAAGSILPFEHGLCQKGCPTCRSNRCNCSRRN